MPEICGDTLGDRSSRFFCFPLTGDPVRNTSVRFPFLFGHFPKSFHYSASDAEKVSNRLRAFPKESSMHFRYCSNDL
jgi:hypothetical protein